MQLGFYKEGRNDQGQTVAFYIPIPPGFTDSERKGISDMLKKEIEKGSGSVAQIVNDNLNQLKEKVLTYHWSRSQAGNGEGKSEGGGGGGGGAGGGGGSRRIISRDFHVKIRRSKLTITPQSGRNLNLDNPLVLPFW